MKTTMIQTHRLAPLSAAILIATSLHVATVPVHAGCETEWLPDSDVNGRVNALTVFDDGDGPALYAGGLFATAGGVTVNYVGKWDGTSWSALGTGMNNEVYTLISFDDGDGPALYAGGVFATAGGEVVNRIAKWDGESWSALGTGLNNSPLALAVFDDGTGPALFVGGQFTTADGVTVNRIAKWDGNTWSPLGSGLNSAAKSLHVFDDGSGPALFVGGGFNGAGGAFISLIAKWDGTSWSSVGPGLGGTAGSAVNAMTVYDDGCGPALFAGGSFNTDGKTTLDRVARWDGSVWRSLSAGVNGTVHALAVFDDGLGDGPELHVGGNFSAAGGVSANRIATWNGTVWGALDVGWSQSVFAIASFDDGGGRGAQLFSGGWFSFWPAGSGYLATFRSCPSDPAALGDLSTLR